MPTVDLSLAGLLHGNFFNFLVLAGLIGIAAVKFDFVGALEQAKSKIEQLLKESDEAKLDSAKTLQTAKDEARNLPAEIAKIKSEAANTVESFKQSSQAELENLTARLEHNAQKVISNEEQKVVSLLQKELGKKSVQGAIEKTVAALEKDENLHRKFIAEAINKLEELEI